MRSENGSTLLNFVVGAIAVITVVAVIIGTVYLFANIYDIKKSDEVIPGILGKSESIIETPEKTKDSKTETNDLNQKIVNNGGFFVKYNEDTYYWKLNDKSRESTGLYANFQEVDSQNSLVKRNSNGNEEIIYVGKGSENIYIYNNMLYTSNVIPNSSDREIYSIDLNTKDKADIIEGIFKYSDDKYIIGQTTKGEIFRININNNECEIIKSGVAFLNVIDNKLYYSTIDANNYYGNRVQTNTIEIGYIEDNKDSNIIATISKDEFESISDENLMIIKDFWKEDKKLNMYVTYVAGSASMEQEEIHVSMDFDGKNIEVEQLKPIEGGGFNETHDVENSQNIYLDSNVLKEEDIINEFNLGNDENDQYYLKPYIIEYFENEGYYIVDYSKYSAEASIGWRDGYERIKTIAFIYDESTKIFTKLFEF